MSNVMHSFSTISELKSDRSLHLIFSNIRTPTPPPFLSCLHRWKNVNPGILNSGENGVSHVSLNNTILGHFSLTVLSIRWISWLLLELMPLIFNCITTRSFLQTSFKLYM